MDLLIPLAVFLGLVLGGGLALAGSFTRPDPVECFSLGLAAGLLGLFLLVFLTHVLALPRGLWLAWPLALGLLFFRRQASIRALLAEPALRGALLQWAILAAWGLGLLLCVQVYGGGYWAGDWLEHYERARFWQLGGPPETRFLYTVYSLGARPPLANAIGGALLAFSGGGFVRHLVLNTLLGSLVVFPFSLLVKRWAPGREKIASALGLVILLVTPFVAQNLAFGWTRHLTSFWVLLGTLLLLRGFDRSDDETSRRLGFLALAAGFLSHYSAGPAIIVAVAAYVWQRRRSYGSRAFLAETSRHAGFCGVLIALWVGWALAALGPAEAFGSNTTAQFAAAQTPAENFHTFLANVRDTLLPHPFREPEFPPVGEQASRAGRVRDFFFNLYQINLPLMFGFGGLGALLMLAARAGTHRVAWLAASASYVLLGVAVHTTRDHLGLGHICLQPLVLLGLARVAAFLASPAGNGLPRVLWATGAGIDLVLGIVLSFALQTHRFGAVLDYCFVVRKNARAMADNGLSMPRTVLGLPDPIVVVLLVLALGAALLILRRAVARSPDPVG